MLRRSVTSRCAPARARVAGVCAVALAAAALAAAAHAAALFRPLTADPREALSRWRMVSYTEDWRYGSDITDSTSHGGVERDRTGIIWEAAGATTFRWQPLRRLFGVAPPWAAWQFSVPVGVFAQFDNTGSLLNTDFQFGGAFDVQWNGRPPDAEAERLLERPVVTSRLAVFHRSSHLGDEYLSQSRFGHNRDIDPVAGSGFDHPPVKRFNLTYEAVDGIMSVEWSPRWDDHGSIARAYGGGESRLALPRSWRVGELHPANFRSPAWRAGAEFRTSANAADPHDGWLTRALDGLARQPRFETGWYGAVDLRLAKPYNFAAGDNPGGETEAWTPRLWTDAPYGREFRHYAGSWHAMLGATLWPRSASEHGAPLAGREWLVSLEWYRGYSPDGQFLDQRLRWHPRWYVVPSVTARF